LEGDNNSANNLLTKELVEWVDIIFLMKGTHRDKVRKNLKLA